MKKMLRNRLVGLFAVLCIYANITHAESDVIAVITPKASKIQKLDKGELSLIYLRKKLYIGEGSRIIPINLTSSHVVRKQFTSIVLGGSPEAQSEYWNEAYYHGITPPHVVASEDAAIKFVEITPGAIAYINACKLTDMVKPVAWISATGIFLQSPPTMQCSE